MELKLNLNLEDNKEAEALASKRVAEAKKKKALAKYEPTWNEVWVTGYTTHTGSTKRGILQTKLTDTDKGRLLAVKEAIESGELASGVDSLRNFTKTKALGLWTALREIRRESIIKQMVAEKPENYHLITDMKNFLELMSLIITEEIIAVDTETTGIEVFGKDVVVGISLTLPEADYHCYIPVRHNVEDIQLKPEIVFKHLKRALEDERIKKVMHNSKFDVHMLRKEGIEVQGLWCDTMVAMHLLNENEPSFALKNLATKYGRYFGFEDKSMTYEELFGKGGFENTPLDIGTVYACKDTHLTYKFYTWIMQQFDRIPQLKKLYFELELPITEVCIAMEKEGFLIDLDFAEKYKIELSEEIEKLLSKIKEGFGEININSNVQLQEVIYKTWGVEAYAKKLGIKATIIKEHFVYDSKGRNVLIPEKINYPVDASTLKKITSIEKEIPQVSYINDLLKYKELNKLLTTYIEPLPQKISSDGRLHGSFNQSATVTGRFASNNPNLQNLPYPARQMFVAPEGKIIIGSDFSQIEPRFLSHISQDKDFMGAYIDGRDLYSEIASKTFKQPIEECGDGSVWRKKAKVVLLGCMYGISAMSLAEQFGLSLEEAEQIYIDFYNSYPTMKAWFNSTNDFANDNGFVQTLMGRKRRFLGHKEIAKKYKILHNRIAKITGKENFNIWKEPKVPRQLKTEYWEVAKEYSRVERQSINAVIQGSSADIMKKAMVDIWKHIKTKGDGWRILATIHDEVLIEIPATATPEEVQEIAEIQKRAVPLSVPMKCDVEVSAVWGKGVSFQEWVDAGCGRKVFE